MIRAKKIRKLQSGKPKPKTRDQKQFEQMVQNVMKSLEAKESDKVFKSQKRDEWAKNYGKKLSGQVLEPRETWAIGPTAKKSIFEPERLDKVDTDEINQRRKEANIDTTIEEASKIAIAEAKAKSKQVGLLFNKAGYQYITASDVKDLGKKSSELE